MATSLARPPRLRAFTVVLALLGPLLVGLTAAPAEAATARPRGLHSSSVATGVVLSWKPVRKATSYTVQVSTTKSFATMTWSVSTVNVKAVPDVTLPLGKLFWRVQATGLKGPSKWSKASFTRSRNSGPALVGPDDGALLEQPEDPPVLRWQPVPGAVSYQVETDIAADEPDWVDTTLKTTKTTSYAVIDPVPDGHYWWRVRAVFANGINTNPSEARSYVIGALRSVVTHDTGADMEQVVLSWDPVPGASTYEIRVSTDNGFNVITDQRTIRGTRYSPTTTYNNTSYWWQVRAKNVLGQAEEWPIFPNETGVFQRSWPERPELVYPAEGQTINAGEDLWFQWTPVQLASSYKLDLSTDPGFSNSAVFKTCDTTQTNYVPSGNTTSATVSWTRCWPPTTTGTFYWRVRAIDAPANVQGIMSDVHSFTYEHPYPAGDTSSMPAVTGQRLVLDGTSAGTADECTAALADGVTCENVTATPMLDWDPVPGAKFYRIYLSRDLNFTNLVYGNAGNPDTLPAAVNTRWMPTTALPDTQAGEAYYWFVRACNASNLCGLTPSQASHAFQKKSPPVDLLTPADEAVVGDQVTFDWTDYLATNQGTTDPATGEHPSQAAKQYHLQVSKSPTFSSPVDDKTVDQTTYTAFDRMYPEGLLYWRVQAVDGSGNGLTWSETRSFTKSSPAPTPISPVDDAVVSGVQPFRWEPLDYASYYDIEIYRNGDTTASSANKAVTGTNLRQTAFTAPITLPASTLPYVWRIRRTDSSNNKSQWSGWRRFTVKGTAAALLKPGAGATVPSTRATFTWKSVAQAASYYVELRGPGDVLYRHATTALAYAWTQPLAKGKWTWRVLSLDADRQLLKASGWRKLRVKG